MYDKHLDSFIKTAKHGSFTKAAKELFISTTALIQQIKLLEKHLGVQLFIRTSRGVTLTMAGKSILQDAENIIRISNDAIERAHKLDGKFTNTIRVGTSLVNKCRFLPMFWEKMIDLNPDMKIEIVSMRSAVGAHHSPLADLGVDFDVREGFYYADLFTGRGNFLEFFKIPFCVALAPKHHKAELLQFTLDDFQNETIVMPEPKISSEFDVIRECLLDLYPMLKIVDIPAYDIDAFAMCEFNGYILITTGIWADIHPALVTKAVSWNFSTPYGVLYPLNMSSQVEYFIMFIKENMDGKINLCFDKILP